MNRVTIDSWLERAILVLVLCVLIFGTLAFGGVRPTEFVVLWALILGALVLWAVRIWAAPKFRFLWPPICWAVLPFVGYAIWRYHTADIEFVARQELIQTIMGVLLFLLVLNNLYSQESIRVLCLSLVFLGLFVASYGIIQWMRHAETVWTLPRPAMYFDRASGSFICPNHLAGLLEMALPIAISLAVTGRIPAVLRICVIYAALVMFVGLAASQSRGGWLAALVGLAFLVFFLWRSKGRRWIALGVFIVVTISGQWLYSRFVQKRVAGAELTGHGREIRLRLWASAWEMWKDQPWWGVGADHFDHRYGKYREPVDRTQGRPGRAHNDFVNTLADYGAVGLLLVLLPIGVAIWSTARCWRHVQRATSELGEKKSNRTAVMIGASAGLVALLVHSFLDFNMHIPANAFVAVTLLAVITCHWRFATERFWVTARWPVAIAGTLALAGCLWWLVPQMVTRTREVALLRRAQKLPDGSKEKIALLQQSYALQPKNFETAFAIGEQLRAVAWTGEKDSDERAQEALVWFRRAIELNKWDVTSYTSAGMCLDWIGKHEEAAPYFEKALEMDPNHWRTRAMMGWHEFQVERFTEARKWMLKSLQLNWVENPLARTYLSLAEKLAAQETSAAPGK